MLSLLWFRIIPTIYSYRFISVTNKFTLDALYVQCRRAQTLDKRYSVFVLNTLVVLHSPILQDEI